MLIVTLPGTADPSCPLGMLQRGRGAGWLAAAKASDGDSFLLHCLQHDPRWATQVESRADYYARLALDLAVDPELIGQIARDTEEDNHLPGEVWQR